jgi:hypothetical protein
LWNKEKWVRTVILETLFVNTKRKPVRGLSNVFSARVTHDSCASSHNQLRYTPISCVLDTVSGMVPLYIVKGKEIPVPKQHTLQVYGGSGGKAQRIQSLDTICK